jgi:hypothetical protein
MAKWGAQSARGRWNTRLALQERISNCLAALYVLRRTFAMTSIGKELLFTAVLCFLLAAGMNAQTINAASCNSGDVQTALNSVNQASATVNIPAGTCTWTSGVAFTVPSGTTSLVVQGAGGQSATTGGASLTGSDATVITDNVNHQSGNQNTLSFGVASGQSLRVTGIALLQNSSSTTNDNGVLSVSGSSTAVRIDHCHFYLGYGDEMVFLGGSIEGVADHDYFDAPAGSLILHLAFHNGSNWNGSSDGYGDESFADTDHWGTSQFFFVEDSYILNGDYVSDCEDGGRFVVRHSTIVNAAFSDHGTAGSIGLSCRAAEIYQNTFTYPATGGSNTLYSNNGGTALVWGNTVSNNQWVVSLDDPRKNNATYPETATPNGWGYCGTGQTGSASAWDGNTNSTGYPCLDGPARGSGDLITGSSFPNVVDSATGTIAWPHQALDPVYIWDNTYNSAGYSSEGMITDRSGMLADNRDYYQQFGTYGESGSFSGTTGVGQGSVAPTTSGAYTGEPDCKAGSDPKTGAAAPGVGWWDTSNNTLYVCTATNTWTAYYTPYTYPHPLTQTTGGVNPPTSLTATPH